MFNRLKQGKPLTVKAALHLSAPHTWPPCSVLPSLFAILLCCYWDYPMPVGWASMLVVICVLMQGSVNTLNDFFDFIKGNDSETDHLEPTDSALVFEQIAPLWAGLWGLAQLALAGLLGLLIVFHAGPAPLIVGVIGAAVVIAYSAGPLPLSYQPVGELISGFVMGGLIPLGILAAFSGRVLFTILPWTVPFILGIGLIMLVNNTSDIEKDQQVRRKTLPALLGRSRATALYRVVLLFWVLAAMLLAWVQYDMAAMAVPVACVAGIKRLKHVFEAKLLPQNRIVNMKGILATNLIINGGYLAALMVALHLKEVG